MTEGRLLILLLFVIILTGCDGAESVVVPEHFQPMIEEADSDGLERLRDYEEAPVYRCYETENGGIAVIQSVEAYEEPMLIYVAVGEDWIREVRILYENETEKYGEYVTEDWFLQRLLLPTDQKLTLVRHRKDTDNEVIAITGATITSEAVVVAVNQSINLWEDYNNEKN